MLFAQEFLRSTDIFCTGEYAVDHRQDARKEAIPEGHLERDIVGNCIVGSPAIGQPSP